MREELEKDNIDKENNIDYKALLFNYFIHWKWFVISVIVCITAAWLYIHSTQPLYDINAKVLIKEDKYGRKSSSAGVFAGMEALGLMNNTNNFNNELEIIKSRTIIQKAVEENNSYIFYYIKKGLMSQEIYKETPVFCYMTPTEALKLKESAKINMVIKNNYSVNVTAIINEEEFTKEIKKLPGLLSTPYGTISFTKNKEAKPLKDELSVKSIIVSPRIVTNSYIETLSVEPSDKMTTIGLINLKSANIKRGIDFVNAVVKQYNIFTNDDKNEIATKTAEFINQRIGIIDEELGSTEKKLEEFKKGAGLTDLTSDAQTALKERSEYEKKRVENITQIQIVQFLKDYANNPSNQWEVLPVNVGLSDNALSQLIGNYNEMLLERKRLLHTSSENNPAVVNISTSIQSMRNSVLTTITSLYKSLNITKKDLDLQAAKYEGKISNAPRQEREFVSISRQQEIKSGLYLMLLQKREENAITLASVANNAQIIDEAQSSVFPISPKKNIIYLIALIVGIGIPIGILYIIDLLKYKIESREDVEKITKVSIIGDIPLSQKDNKNNSNCIVVKENKNDMMAEVFRNIRTNLLYMLDKNEKVIMFTSSKTGEGKSFVVSNTAMSFALMGKKVLTIGLDIRKPGLNKAFGISHKKEGITAYLSDSENTDLNSLIIQSEFNENLYILPGGSIPPNPTELLMRPALDKALSILKEKFDYILIDTAPIGTVTDTQIISHVADVTVYLCRADVTTKTEYTYINYLEQEKKINKLCTLINGIDISNKKYGYIYGYGKYGSYGQKYGYSKKHGYGYGYGYDKLE